MTGSLGERIRRGLGSLDPAHLGAVLAGVAVSVVLFPAGGRDDVHISLWPAQTLAELGQIVNYNGERVEQSSSLLWVLVLAALRKISGGVDLTLMAPAVSLACAVAVLALVPRLGRTLGLEGRPWAVLLLGTSPWFAYWAASGMETSLAALSIIGVTAALHHDVTDGRVRWTVTVPLFAAYAAVRPEAWLVLGALSGGIALTGLARARSGPDVERGRGRALLRVGAQLLAVTVVIAGTLAFARWLYFDSPVPQPVLAKGGAKAPLPALAGAGLGVLYVGAGLCTWLLPVTVLGSLYLWRLHRRRALVSQLPILAVGLAALAFVITSGGDWMEGYRFLVPTLSLLAVLAGAELAALPQPALRRGLGAGIAALQIIACVYFSGAGSSSVRLWEAGAVVEGVDPAVASWRDRSNIVQLRDLQVTVTLGSLIAEMRRHGTERPVIWSPQGGFVPFTIAKEHYGHFTWIDPAGLLDRRMWDCAGLHPYIASSTFGIAPRDYIERALAGESINPMLLHARHRDAIDACGIPAPDLFMTLGVPADSAELLAAYDLVPVFVHDGIEQRRTYGARPLPLESLLALISDRPEDLERRGLGASFIAARRDIAQRLGWLSEQREARAR